MEVELTTLNEIYTLCGVEYFTLGVRTSDRLTYVNVGVGPLPIEFWRHKVARAFTKPGNVHGHKRTTYERISLNEKIWCATLSEIGFKTTSDPYEIRSVTTTLRFKSS
ncbi:unnamed protein product [Linum trigynum]|uniref:Uncharacterized protein n=1 Tax=Linum trigynum TaxID=586398 RepID=A0AAV2E020_9ROSI